MDPNTVAPDQIGQKMQSDYELIQRNTILLALPGLFLGVILLGVIMSTGKGYEWALSTAIGLIVLIFLIGSLSRKSFLAASLVLIVGLLAAMTAVVAWGKIGVAACLLFLPVGIATLALGAPGGSLTAAACTALLVFAPGEYRSIDISTRVVAGVSIWSTLGLIWLTLRPLLTVVDWSWRAYENSFTLLTQSRQYQMHLNQALEDLKNTNTQLNRLNILANNLRKIAEDERRIKAQFVANVSHELRTPLNMIIGFCEMILKAPESYGERIPPNLLADLQVIFRNSQHLSSLIDDVLDLSQIEAGQMALVKEWVQAKEITDAVLIAVKPLYESRHLYLQAEVEENLPAVFCDRTRIREVLLNLLSNAGRFTEKGGVQVSIRQDGNYLQFRVTDTGPGISEEDQERLFQPFQQLDNSIRRRHGGTGLGLSISKSFIELHDGKMWVESEKGIGTTFSFRLPVEPFSQLPSPVTRWINPHLTYASIERLPRTTTMPQVDSRPHVLVIEKGTVLQRLLRRYLHNVDIGAAADLDLARAAMDHAPARAVLINDLNAMTDLATISWLPPSTPVIACSIAEQIQFAPGPNIPDMLVKPIGRDVLLGALEKLNSPVKTILVVDDEVDAQKLFVRMISSAKLGYRALRASNGQQALDLLNRQKVDVILLDLIMPEMDGFQFLKIKAQDPLLRDIPVILISARDPHNQPIVSNMLAATCSGGLSVQQLLDCIQALSSILSSNGFPVTTQTEKESPTTDPPVGPAAAEGFPG